MSLDAAIQHALREAGLPDTVRDRRNLSGGCIHTVMQVTLDEGRDIVAKATRETQRGLFDEEACSLQWLAKTDTVLTPAPFGVYIHDGHAVLLMEAVQPGRSDDSAWKRFGEELAALHHVDVGRQYGFEIDNHLGGTFQPNTWCDDWVTFNAEHRLGHQRRLATDAGRLDKSEAKRIDHVIDRLDERLPRHPKPALLHGDLWAGNALEAEYNRIAIIDPACSIGDGWADIAMMQLFGGFPPACLDAYADAVDDHDGIDDRIAVYQLYHILNHLNLFGRGYAGQAMRLADRLGA